MTEFDAATAAVQAALDAGARYADARVMHRRYESMSARNGDIEELTQDESIGLGVRALVGSSWGFHAVPDLSDAAARDAGRRAARIAAASARVPGPPVDLVPAEAVTASWASGCEVDPLGVPLSDKGDLLVGATATMAEHGADLAEGLYQVWDTAKWFVSSEGHRIDQRIRECGGGISATSIGDGETQRRSYPSYRGQYGTTGWELVESLDLAAHAARIAEESRALLTAPLCPAGETDLILGGEQLALQIHESVGHAIELDRILGWEAAFAGTSWLDLAQLGSLRYGSELMNITIDPTIPGALGSFGFDDEGSPAVAAGRGPRRPLGRGARRPGLGRRRRPRLRRQRTGRRLGPAADGADDQRRPGARPAHPGGDHRGHRRRGADGHQPVLVDRRQAAQLPVRLRGRLGDQEGPAGADAAQPDVHRDRPALLALDGHALVGDRRLGHARTAARASPARSGTPATRPRRPGSAASGWGCAA